MCQKLLSSPWFLLVSFAHFLFAPVYTVSAQRYLPASGVLCLLLSLEGPSHLLQCHLLREAISGGLCHSLCP